MSPFTLRPRRPEDRGFLSELYASTRADELQPLPWTDDQKRDFLAMQFDAQTASWDEQFPDAEWSIVEIAGKAAGRLYLDRRPDEIRIVDIALMPEHRGQGLGAKLLQHVFDEASSHGLAVRIHVEKNNPARRLYDRLGFREIADVGVYFLMEWTQENTASK